MAQLRLDPPPSDVQYRAWARTAAGPATWAGVGSGSAGLRRRGERLSRLMDGHERERVERVSLRSPWTGKVYVVRRRT